MYDRPTDIARQGRHDRFIKEKNHDPYRAGKKLPEPTVCPECGLVFSGGRWQRVERAPTQANEHACPACRRIHDRVPAGYLTLGGEFFMTHRDEIMQIMHNRVAREQAEHPLNRLMATEDQPDGGTVVTFTDMHLPRAVGEAIASAHQGEIDIQYAEESGIVRVNWTR